MNSVPFLYASAYVSLIHVVSIINKFPPSSERLADTIRKETENPLCNHNFFSILNGE